MMSRSQSPLATSTRASSMTSSAGVWMVAGSRALAICPGVAQLPASASKYRSAELMMAVVSVASTIAHHPPVDNQLSLVVTNIYNCNLGGSLNKGVQDGELPDRLLDPDELHGRRSHHRSQDRKHPVHGPGNLRVH